MLLLSNMLEYQICLKMWIYIYIYVSFGVHAEHRLDLINF